MINHGESDSHMHDATNPKTGPKMKPTSPFKMMMPLVVFILIAAAWSAYWYIALGKAKDELAQVEGTHTKLECSDRSWGGYPFRIQFECTDLKTRVQKTALTTAKLRLVIQAWNPNHIIGNLFGPVRIAGTKLTGDPIRFSYRMSGDKLVLASVVGENQTLILANSKSLSMASIEAHARPAPIDGRLDLHITIANIALEQLRLDSFTITGTTGMRLPADGSLDLLSEPSEYLDAIWIAQSIGGLADAEMNAADAVIKPLLKSNGNKLPIQIKDGVWYWGPFPLNHSKP